MENEKSMITPVQQMVISALASIVLTMGLQHFFPETQTGRPMVNAVMSGLWGLVFSSWMIQFQTVRALRRANQKLLAAAAPEAPAEPAKAVDVPVEVPVVAAPVEPVVVVVAEKKVEAAAPAKKSVVIKKKAK